MNIIYENRRFLNLGLGESVATDYPSDNLGDVVTVELDVRVDDYVIAQGENLADLDAGITVIVIHPPPRLTGRIKEPSQLWTNDPTGFESIKEGDEITIDNIGASPVAAFTITRTVIEVVNSQLLLVDVDFTTPPYDVPIYLNKNSVVYYSTPIQSLEFFAALIENNEAVNFIDKLTGLTRRAKVEGLDNTDQLTEHPMTLLGDKSYQYGTLTVRGNGHGDGPDDPIVSQAFTITQTFLVGPLSRADIVSSIKSSIAPPWLLDNNSLKFVSRIEMSKDLNNPNDIKTGIEDEILGNVGNSDEHLNTGLKSYTVSDVVYARADLTVIDSIELTTNEITVTFFVNNASGPFSDGNTKLVFSHFVLHENPDEYSLPRFPDPSQDYPARDRLRKENQLFDRIECTLGTLATTPDNLGGDDQIIKECDSELITANQIKVTATIQMSAAAVARIGAISGLNYKIIVSTADHTKTRALSDKEAPTVDVQPYFIETTDPQMITPVNGFILHTGSDVDTDQVESTVLRPGDDFVPVTIFSLNRNDVANYERANAAIDFTSITAQIIAKKGDESFVLDEENQTLTNLPIIINATYGTIPEIDVTKDRGFSSPVDDLRRDWRIKRRSDLDAAGLFYYEVDYPCVFRWSAWQQLKGVNEEFYDRTAPSNEFFGKNHDWAHYFNATGWACYYRITIVATKDGIPITYTLDSQLLVEQYLEGDEWDTEAITAFKTDATGTPGDAIVQGPQSGAMQNDFTLIRAEKTYIGADANPTLPDLETVFLVSIFEGTDYKGAFLISSLYDLTGLNPWVGLNGILKTTKTNPSGDIFRAEAILQAGFFDPSQQIRIGARYYDKRPESGIPDGKTTEGGVLKTDEIGFVKDIE